MSEKKLVEIPVTDASTTIADLRAQVGQFVAERDWHQFHSPKNLTMSLAIETAELMEHFQWISPDQSRQIGGNGEKKKAVGDEMADVFCYLLALANELQVDLSAALQSKMSDNERKYPADIYRGKYGEADLAT